MTTRRAVALLGFLLVFSTLLGTTITIPTSAQPLVLREPGYYTAFAYESITVADTAIGFTSATYAPAGSNFPAVLAVVTVEANPMRYRYDGTNPTSSEGHPVFTPTATLAESFEVLGYANIQRFRAIRTGGSSATMKVTYHRWEGGR